MESFQDFAKDEYNFLITDAATNLTTQGKQKEAFRQLKRLTNYK